MPETPITQEDMEQYIFEAEVPDFCLLCGVDLNQNVCLPGCGSWKGDE